MIIPTAILAASAALFMAAAVCDARRYQIPNGFSVLLAVLFVVYAFLRPAGLSWPGHLMAGGAVFAVGAGLFFVRLMGGGDVKLLAAAALWAGPAGLSDLLAVTTLGGGALALVMLAAGRRHALAPSGAPAASPGQGRVPYGVAIAAGALWSLAVLASGV